MADRKITDLTALAAGSQATGDLLTIVDVSEAAATDKNKKITVESLFKGIPSNVGIGTSSPGAKLSIAEQTYIDGGFIRFLSNASSPTGTAMWRPATDTLAFNTTSTERLRIDSSGNVGIGTSSPAGNLQISGSGDRSLLITGGTSGTTSVQMGDSSDADAGAILYDNSNNSMQFKTNASERMRIDSSGRLLIGTTTEGEGSADNLTIADSGNCGITLRSGTGNSGGIYFSDATSGGGEYDGLIAYHQGNRFLQFWTAQTERMRIDSSGNVGIGTTSPTLSNNSTGIHIHGSGSGGSRLHLTDSNTGTAKSDGTEIVVSGSDLYIDQKENASTIFYTNGSERARILSSGGITFNGDTAAANALDDYEEGTWTPDFNNRTSSAPNIQEGVYRKIGSQVFAFFHLNCNATLTTSSAQMRITGLPFPAKSGGSTYGPLSSLHWNNSWTFADNEANLNGLVPPGASYVDMYYNQGSTNQSVPTNRFGTGNVLGCIMYFVA